MKRCKVKGDLLKCHKCSAVFTKKFNLRRHLKIECQKQFKCVCLKEFAKKQSLIDHMVTHKPKVITSKPRKDPENSNAISESCDLMLAYGEDSELDLNWLYLVLVMTAHMIKQFLYVTYQWPSTMIVRMLMKQRLNILNWIILTSTLNLPVLVHREMTLAPAARQRKSMISKEHTAYVQSLELTPEDQVKFL